MKNEFANGIKKLFFIAITLLSAVTSFLYFVEVFSLGRGLVSDTWMAVLINGFVGVLVLDIAAIAWLKIYLGASDNNTVRSLAATGFVIGLIGSGTSSFAYLFSVADGFTLPADMRVYTQVVMAAIIVIHFVLVFLSSYKSTQARIDEKVSAMLAEGTEEMLKLTEDYFREDIPHLAQQNARKLTDQLRGQFATLSSATGAPALPPPAANGHHPPTSATNKPEDEAQHHNKQERMRRAAADYRKERAPAALPPGAADDFLATNGQEA